MGKRIVFTGGLSSGKTTTINMLHDLGYEVILESSESAIVKYKNTYGGYPWENKVILPFFHNEVINKQIENEKNIGNGVVFLDRGLPDRLAFLKFDGLQVSDSLLKQAKLCHYDKVFFFEGSDSIYRQAPHRPHSDKDSRAIAELVKEIYEKLEYDIEVVPFCSREERLQIILKNI